MAFWTSQYTQNSLFFNYNIKFRYSFKKKKNIFIFQYENNVTIINNITSRIFLLWKISKVSLKFPLFISYFSIFFVFRDVFAGVRFYDSDKLGSWPWIFLRENHRWIAIRINIADNGIRVPFLKNYIMQIVLYSKNKKTTWV